MKKKTKVWGAFVIAASTLTQLRRRVAKIEAKTRFRVHPKSTWTRSGAYYLIIMKWKGKARYGNIQRDVERMETWDWIQSQDSNVFTTGGIYIFCEGEFL